MVCLGLHSGKSMCVALFAREVVVVTGGKWNRMWRSMYGESVSLT